jgi:excisionase family DNA binding protein
METCTDAIRQLAYSLNRAAALIDLSRRSLYRVIDSGDLRTVKVGARRLVPARELERLVKALGQAVGSCAVSSSRAYAVLPAQRE